MTFIAETLALLLPPLDVFTRSAWLVDFNFAWSELALIAANCAVYASLLTAAALFDFYRRNF